MIVEVFKSYDDGLLLFNAIYPATGWFFESYNQRDGETAPPYRESGWVSAAAPADKDRPDTIYFDTKHGRYKLKSTVKNVVIDLKPPELVSWSGKYTVFRGEKWSAEFVIRDDSGIDSGVYRIAVKGKDADNQDVDILLEESSRKNSDAPAFFPTVDPDGRDRGVKITFEQSQNDNKLYRIKLEIDPNELPEHALIQCNNYISYAKFSLIVYDIAGNQIDIINPKSFPKTFAVYEVDKSTILDGVKKLTLDFVDTYPPGLIVGSDMIGKTTLVAGNPNVDLLDLGFDVVFGLKSDSVGYLSGIQEEPKLSGDGTYYIHTHDVDGIDRTGYVQAFAYLDGNLGNISCDISGENISVEIDADLSQDVKGATYVEKDLGKFLSECVHNKRKIYIDTMVPDILKGEEFYNICKMFETYLNTIYSPMEGDCRIGILEKTHRISEFKDPRECESKLLTRYADEHGTEFKFTREDVERVAEIMNKYAKDPNRVLSKKDLADKIYRRYYEILPYINMWKGTEKSFELIYQVLGLRVELFPLWEGPKHDLVREDKAGDDYWLTSHLEVEVHGEYEDEDLRALSSFSLKAAKSILPVIRVIGNSAIVNDLVEDEESLLNMTVIDLSSDKTVLLPEYAIFSWENKKIPAAKIQRRDLELYLPIDAKAIFCKDSEATKKADTNPAFWFSRWGSMRDTYGTIPIRIAFGLVNTDSERHVQGSVDNSMDIYPDYIEIRQNRIVLHMADNEQNRQYLNTWNIWTSKHSFDATGFDTKNTIVMFKFFRSEDLSVTLENYCSSVNSVE